MADTLKNNYKIMTIGQKTKKLFNVENCQKNTQKTRNFEFKNT